MSGTDGNTNRNSQMLPDPVLNLEAMHFVSYLNSVQPINTSTTPIDEILDKFEGANNAETFTQMFDSPAPFDDESTRYEFLTR